MAKILVVDDDPRVRILYQREFTDEGFEVRLAANAREALEVFQADRPDVVLLDIRMPGMDGMEVMERMLILDRTVPVIINSSYAAYKDDFRSWLADTYVDKSPDMSSLKQAVGDLMERCQRV